MALKEEVRIILGLEGTAQVNAGLDQVANKFGKANAQIKGQLQGLAGVGRLLGNTVAPELQRVATISISALGDIKNAANASGISFGAVAAGIGAIGAELFVIRKAWMDMTAAINDQEAATKRLGAARGDLTERIKAELDLWTSLGLIGENQRQFVTVGPIMGDPRQSSSMGYDPQAAARRLSMLRDSLGLRPDQPFDAARAEAQMRLLDGTEKELAMLDLSLEKQKKINEEMFRRKAISDAELRELNRLAELDREFATVAIHRREEKEYEKTLTDERVKAAKEATEAAKEEERAMASIVASAREIAEQRRRGLALAADFAFGAQMSRAGDSTLSPGNRAGLLGQAADMELGRDMATINQEIQDEETRNLAIQDARTIHAQKMIEIARMQAAAEQEIEDRRVDDAGTMLGAMSDLAKQFGKEAFIAYKVTAIGQALINTYLGASKALVDGDSYSAAFRFAAAIAMGTASVAQIASQQPGYAVGGYTGDMAPHLPAGVVHGREFVFSAPATAAIGRGNLEAMHDAAKSGGGGGMKAQRVVVIDDRRQVRDLQHDPEFETVVVDIANRNKWRMG